ncbi:phenylalanine and histidine ammonia-lyase like protein, partial [Zymoseptoria brevis]
MHSNSIYDIVQRDQHRITALRKGTNVPIDGRELCSAELVAIARNNCIAIVHEDGVLSRLQDSVGLMEGKAASETVYGLNTGFGGNADTRPCDQYALAKSLLQTLQSGVLLARDRGESSAFYPDVSASNAMPSSWVRAITATRINQCIRGHSAIPRNTIDMLLNLRDLMPLAYLAGLVEGSPAVYATVGVGDAQRVVSAKEAIAECGLIPLTLGPREALGIVNGTAASAAVAALGTFDATRLAILSAGLTALMAEAMSARVEWLDPFISDVRPHWGQREASHIVRSMLEGSSLVSGLSNSMGSCRDELPTRPDGGLAQDRYTLRTAPQWLGPLYEDLALAYDQVSIELNSTSDNPLTNLQTGRTYHNGNFQAVSVTSATEKVRFSIQMMGKLLLAQCTEVINHQMNHGLPPNLAADDPSHSFCLKGLDINMAAY